MSLFKEILADNNLIEPDGRPLYQLKLSEIRFVQLPFLVKGHLEEGRVFDHTAALFVLWAAEYIRREFKGGALTWEFLAEKLGYPLDDNKRRTSLVERGLRRWRREVRVSEQGVHLYLYSLMAEGGLPQSLLTRPGLYNRLFKGILAGVEQIGGAAAAPDLIYNITARRAEELPQSFQSTDIVHLLAELALIVAALRAKAPNDIPAAAIDEWLDAHCPDWQKDLPLKLSDEIAAALIRPALRAERQIVRDLRPIAARLLRRGGNGAEWQPCAHLAAAGYLPARFLPPAEEGALLRLQVRGLDKASRMIIYNATLADGGGWELSCAGGAGICTLPLARGLSLAAYDDGRFLGEVEILPPVPEPAEFPCFWEEESGHNDEENEGGRPDYLSYLGETGETAFPHIYLLAGKEEKPEAAETVNIAEAEIIAEGESAAQYRLWRLGGSGCLTAKGQEWQVKTEAEQKNRHIAFIAEGRQVASWQLAKNGAAVFIGRPNLWGQRGDMPFQPVPEREICRRPDKQFLTEIAEWVKNGKIIARLSYAALPEEAALDLHEIKAGEVKLVAHALPQETLLLLSAGGKPVQARADSEGNAELFLSVGGEAPGMVNLTLADSANGRYIELAAPWPARNAMLLSPDNRRLKHDCQISLASLEKWKIAAPQSGFYEIQLALDARRFFVKTAGERPLAADMPLIRSMLAYAGADAEMRLNIISDGRESRYLSIRRYDGQAKIEPDGKLQLGFADERDAAQDDNIPMRGQAIISAVDLKNPNLHWREDLTVNGPIDLKTLLPQEGQKWFIQAILNGKIQRAAVWFANEADRPRSTRNSRIKAYRQFWQELAERGACRDWQMQWQIILEVMQGGDAAALDQVQALAQEHEALILLLLNAPRAEIPQVLSLDECAPFSWFCLNIECYKKALRRQYHGLIALYKPLLEAEQQAAEIAADNIAGQIKGLLIQRPELAAHFGAALMEADLWDKIPVELKGKLAKPALEEKLKDIAMEAARRARDLPAGIGEIRAEYCPKDFPQFDSDAQKLIDAPFVAAEIACDLREPPGRELMLTLIYLRHLDNVYFDKILPYAVSYLIAEKIDNAEKLKTL